LDAIAFRNIPLPGMNIRNVIISYFIEVINAMVTFSTVPLIYALTVSPLPFAAAQWFAVVNLLSGTLMAALGTAISCFQILYVVAFETVFAMDPLEVGRRTIAVLTLVTGLPIGVAGIYDTFSGIHAHKSVAVLTRSEYNGENVQFLVFYPLIWLALFFAVSSIAFGLFPLFYKTNQNLPNNQMPLQEKTTVYRYIVGILTFIVTSLILYLDEEKADRHTPMSGYLFLFSMVCLQAYLFTEKEARNMAKKWVYNLLHIEECIIDVAQ
jgi:hypothetical protein